MSISFLEDGSMMIVGNGVLIFRDHVRSAHLTSKNELMVFGAERKIGFLDSSRLTRGEIFIGRVILEAIHARFPLEWTVCTPPSE